MTTMIRAIMAFLGLFMLMPGVVKFVEPFKTYFATQIANSELPFPAVAYWAGQLGEISVGLVLFSLVFCWNFLQPSLLRKAFYFSHSLVAIIMMVSLYVHAHPAVPKEVLPMEEKFPYLSILLLIGIAVNAVLVKKVLFP